MPISFPSTVVGIDVGGQRKGLHAVALCDGIYLDRFHTLEVDAMVAWCRHHQARVIAIDAPCRWSSDGPARLAERQLMAAGIFCFSSPTAEAACTHPRNYYGWMLNGMALYRALADTHPFCSSASLTVDGCCCFETFPQAIACSLAGHILAAKDKRRQRPRLLTQAGINLPAAVGIDTVDAALCALAAHRFATHQPCTVFGEPESGLIIVPASASTGALLCYGSQ